MTYAEIEGDENGGVRRLIGDHVEPFRFSALEIYGYVNDAVRMLYTLRPSAFFVDGRMPTSSAAMQPLAPSAVANESGALDVPAPAGDRYTQAFMYYVAGRCLERDDADTMNKGLSESYLARFAELARV